MRSFGGGLGARLEAQSVMAVMKTTIATHPKTKPIVIFCPSLRPEREPEPFGCVDEDVVVGTVELLVLDVSSADVDGAGVPLVVAVTIVVGTSDPKNDEAISESVDAAADCTSSQRPERED